MTKNINYRKFLDQGEIKIINEDTINLAINNVKGRYMKEGRSLLIALYYSGARPNEVLNLRSRDIYREGTHLCIKLPSSKGGLPRIMRLQYKRKLVKELYNYAHSLFKDMLLFYHYRDKYIRVRKTKKGVKEVVEITNKLRYHVNLWFESVIDGSINPYFLRHNRFSALSEKGATLKEIQLLKGCRTVDSISHYVHLSTDLSKRVASKIE